MSSADANQASSLPVATLRALAEAAARLGGDVARRSFGQRQKVTLKRDRSEVTETDLAAERAIIAHIRAARPSDRFIGEEATDRGDGGKEAGGPPAGGDASGVERHPESAGPDSGTLWWIIDPIDGTRNYVRQIPIFACSVAAVRDGSPLAGAIYDPVQDAMYSAGLREGAFVNGQRVALAQAGAARGSAPPSKLLVGIPSARRPSTRRFALHAVERHVIRNLGSAALHLAMLANGQLDVVVVGNCKLWDIAAGCLIVTEAGCIVTSPDGKPLFPLDVARYAGEEIAVLAGNPSAYARFRESVAEA